jgi:hypothetical protein
VASSGLNRLLRAIAHLILAGSIAHAHLGRGFWTGASVAWRVLPPRLRRPLLSAARLGRGSPLIALGLAAAGRRIEARDILQGGARFATVCPSSRQSGDRDRRS